jgi:putative acetyltransferase
MNPAQHPGAVQLLEITDGARPDVLQVHDAAFGRPDEAALVAALVRDPTAAPVASIVAVVDNRIVGHALFTALSLEGSQRPVSCSILAPLAVMPAHQGAGIGRALIEHGCSVVAARGVQLVFVLGDPRYYTRCGFQPAVPHALLAPYPIEPEAAWMVRTLEENLLGTVAGTVRCAQSLSAEHYWRE